jgi:NAD(P)-dependent dehydrogenase (short-subunit alcohol dehydrogenase family)
MSAPTYSFAGRNGIVTGAGSGIGKAVALKLVAAGAKVLGVSRRAGLLEALAMDLAGAPGRLVPFAADVTEEAAVTAYVEKAESELGPVSFFFNNAGTGGAHKSIVETSVEELDATMALNFRACFLGLKHVIPAMRRAGGGQIVNNGSLLSLRGGTNRADYTASKHAVLGLTRSAAVECAGDNIQVNIVCPGPVDTPLQRQSEELVNPGDPGYERRRYEAGIPMGRYGRPTEVADTVIFLLSGAVPYLSGAAIVLDGAYMAA